jgi:hypothetical protein
MLCSALVVVRIVDTSTSTRQIPLNAEEIAMTCSQKHT